MLTPEGSYVHASTRHFSPPAITALTKRACCLNKHCERNRMSVGACGA